MFLTLLIVLGAVLTYVLLAPLRLTIDSRRDTYRAQWGRLVEAHWYPDQEGLPFEFRFLGFRRKRRLVEWWKPGTKQTSSPGKVRRGSRWRYRPGPRRILRLLQSFRLDIRRLRINTGDMVLNALLYPLAYMIPSLTGRFEISFQQPTEVDLVLENRLIRLFYYFIL